MNEWNIQELEKKRPLIGKPVIGKIDLVGKSCCFLFIQCVPFGIVSVVFEKI